MLDKAEIRLKEQNDKAETCRENLWNKYHEQKEMEWASSVGLS